ncbi:hypothetical protein [Fimbriimonas ginsengisoli]|uniref:Uncharacterized protein n=1 Tax=Fimbriimonas ginsengisoli Gsoil 348 TaxID=661478 RepID=A0A068NL58_FIMGI|nr:hypothetical protein [Fimbriimonas ginsengisoli]AIE83500.1 hypothetical protein OP10G_0132 [Fimbriimonas ginsengisoli Gsoil 348]
MAEPPVYDRSQGEVDYGPKARTVVIAGRPRKGIVYCDPRVEEAWRQYDLFTTPRPEVANEPH